MKCRHSQRLFSRHLDDRLSEGEWQELERHLAGCAACRAELVRWEVPSSALRAMRARRPEPPDGAADGIWRAVLAAMAASRAAPSFEERFVWAARRAAAVGVLAAGLVWGGLLLRGASPGDGAMAELGEPDAT
ncbi:MAG TPA: zf-HC2 domain-containing protein, partial [Kofleriaceae bacterium]|nr:zf-HC2 domain-containing protein [Kofleriaceae bacterium]